MAFGKAVSADGNHPHSAVLVVVIIQTLCFGFLVHGPYLDAAYSLKEIVRKYTMPCQPRYFFEVMLLPYITYFLRLGIFIACSMGRLEMSYIVPQCAHTNYRYFRF